MKLPSFLNYEDVGSNLNFITYGYFRTGPLPTSKYERDGEFWEEGLEYGPPTLNLDAALKGIYKHVHEWITIPLSEYNTLHHWNLQLWSPFLAGVEPWSLAEARMQLDPSKAAGWPWCTFAGALKEDVLSSFTDEQLVTWFENFTAIHSITLKSNEMRLDSKAARAFVPSPVEMAFIGNYLYGPLMKALNHHKFKHPSTVGISVPGADIARVFSMLSAFCGRMFDADGKGWDGRVPLWAIMLLRDLITVFIPKSRHALHYRYFSMTFFHWTLCNGFLILIPGQSTGNTLTSFGNTLMNAMLVMLHAIRSKMSFSTFRRDVLFFCNGDDLIYSTRDPVFDISNLNDTYMSVGMYLESSSLEPKRLEDLTYLSAYPYWKEYLGMKVLFYGFNARKILSSFGYRRTDNAAQNLSRYVNLCYCLFGHQELFNIQRNKVLAWYGRVNRVDPSVFDTESHSLISHLVDDEYIFRLYTRNE